MKKRFFIKINCIDCNIEKLTRSDSKSLRCLSCAAKYRNRNFPGRFVERICSQCNKKSRVRRDGAGKICRSCSAIKNSKNKIGKFINITGLIVGKLTVISPSHQVQKLYFWNCKCECGKECIISGSRLRNSTTKSCGCIVKKQNGLSTTGSYKSWDAMMQRCYDKKVAHYERYGGKGIVVCERWHKFLNFFEDMGSRPENYTLDRIDPFGNYELNNCRWATYKQQAINKQKKRT